jgi:hypothetical protein
LIQEITFKLLKSEEYSWKAKRDSDLSQYGWKRKICHLLVYSSRQWTSEPENFQIDGFLHFERFLNDVSQLGTPIKKRFADGSSPESPATPLSAIKRYSVVSAASADLRTPTPRRKRQTNNGGSSAASSAPSHPPKRLLSCDSPEFEETSPVSVSTPFFPRRSAATQAKTRVDGSLITITQGFIDLLSASDTKSLDINKVAMRLNIPKRRIYDITNALEGIGFLKKGVKNMVHWT